MAWNTSCADWEERLLGGLPPIPGLPLFDAEASRALRIFKRLHLPDVIGTPTMGDAAGPWFFEIVRALFGAYDADANRRMIQELFLLVPKKNMKSTGAAGIMVTAAIVNRRPEAEFTLVAPTIEVTGIAFKQARGIVKRDPELDKLFQVRDHIRTIQHRKTGAYLQIKAADTDVITGSKASGTLIDETHVFAKRANAADIFVELRGALAARPDGFLIQITTQSKDPPAGVFRQELATARDVRDGKIQLPLLPVLYELPQAISKDGGWKNRQYWPLVNPNLGRSVDEAFLENQLLKAERDGPEAMALLASQHFNVEIGLSLRSDRWAGAEYWESCADPLLTLDEIKVRCEICVVGIDGGGLDDLLGLAVLGRDKDTREWLLWTHAWAHRSVFERRKDVASTLHDFANDGDLTIVENIGDDVREVADIVEELEIAGLLPAKIAIGVDQAGISEIVDELSQRGIAPDRIGGVPQGWKLTNAIKTAERKLAGGALKHGGQKLMDWQCGNAKVEARGNAVIITKQTAGSAKIDCLMAMFDAIVAMGQNPDAGPSVYEEHDLFVM